MMRILCRLGFHNWEPDTTTHPFWPRRMRACRRCDHKMWLAPRNIWRNL